MVVVIVDVVVVVFVAMDVVINMARTSQNNSGSSGTIRYYLMLVEPFKIIPGQFKPFLTNWCHT